MGVEFREIGNTSGAIIRTSFESTLAKVSIYKTKTIVSSDNIQGSNQGCIKGKFSAEQWYHLCHSLEDKSGSVKLQCHWH